MTVIADVVEDVVSQLKIQGAAGEAPTDSIQGYVLRAYQELSNVCPPVKQEALAVAASGWDRTATTTGLEVYHVGKGANIFVPGVEWSQSGTTIHLQNGAADDGDEVWTFIRADLGMTMLTEEIDDDLYFGDQFYRAGATIGATLMALFEMARVAGSAGGGVAGGAYRSLQPQYEAIRKDLQTTYVTWRAEMDRRVQMALQLGSPPLVAHPYARLTNRSRMVNRLLGHN